MQRSLIIACAAVLTLLFADTLAVDGVKGGHRSHQGVKGGRSNQNVAVNSTVQAGLCYKTIPYAVALVLNSTGEFPHNTLPSTNEGEATNGFITILDCCDGYERNLTSGGCEPCCKQGCFGGKCIAPDVCACPPGWFPQEGICMPYCDKPCQKDAYCFSPNVCACKLRYDEVNGECKPICPGGCKNGECVAPQLCRCKPGYAVQPSLETETCMPVCNNCRNGDCTAPGMCTCREGYINPQGDTSVCVPNCPEGCTGGDCVSPGVCKCKPGFSLDFARRCIPECPQGCTNGQCIAPGVCNCDPGYLLESVNKCVPHCPRGCTNGVCVAPGICNCNEDYTLDPNGRCVQDCPPQCYHNGERCICTPGRGTDPYIRGEPFPSPVSPSLCRYGCGLHGTCTAPNTCVCEHGFTVEPDTGRCMMQRTPQTEEPLCEKPCINGECTGLNQCSCNRGYTMNPNDPTRTKCMPVCVGGCPNGVCTAPNLCICNLGYKKEAGVKGRQRCVPAE